MSKPSIVDVSMSKVKGGKLRRYVEDLIANIPKGDELPVKIILNKRQYIAAQHSRKLRRLTKSSQWDFLVAISPPEEYLYWTKNHVMEVEINEGN